jgi:hypothetical protein
MYADYAPITDRDEIVQADWCYSYDLGFFDSPTNPDMRVWTDAVGKPARTASSAWECFYKPKPRPVPEVVPTRRFRL